MTSADRTLERGQTLAQVAEHHRAEDGSWFVQSESRPDSFYHVTLSGEQVTCTCPAYTKHHSPCKHCVSTALVALEDAQR